MPHTNTYAENSLLLITGATGGVGGAVATMAQAQGLPTVLTSRSVTPAADANTLAIAADVSTATGARSVIEAATAHFGRSPNLLCHAVGSAALAPPARVTAESWSTTLRTNLDSAFFVLQAFSSALSGEGREGAAVFFSSVAARLGTPNHIAVAAAKGGVEALVRAAATDFAAKRIRVNALALGLVETTLTAGFIRDERMRAAVDAQYPLGRHGQPGEIGAWALRLLDTHSGWITGQIIPIDGGFTAIRPMVRAS